MSDGTDPATPAATDPVGNPATTTTTTTPVTPSVDDGSTPAIHQGMTDTSEEGKDVVLALPVAQTRRGIDTFHFSYSHVDEKDVTNIRGMAIISLDNVPKVQLDVTNSKDLNYPRSYVVPAGKALTVTLTGVAGAVGRVSMVQNPANFGIRGGRSFGNHNADRLNRRKNRQNKRQGNQATTPTTTTTPPLTVPPQS